ncbi:class I SAM-dependent DNA methyltransferase [Clostridium sp. Cult2]|uniref:class I SAM-dependent DNA methyltransferase n=1 Tax=Clostridium sp. Cult2 TaxID=2079003 RepID=UPI001F3209B4|nr:class I SAM-dependent methyltransferase [Clostridium sp. Cult2]MCF6465797.1 class I SAM-dependent methyltransferase [Clostridium sp. Cult2]
MYEDFAFLYDQLMMDIDYKEWYSYIKDIMEKFHKNPKSVLEMACGTGNLSYYLAKDGFDLTCFDLSTDMLSIAYNKLREFKNVNILNQNMIDFQLNKKFDGVLSICDSINYIIDKDNLLNTFKNVKNHLNPDGIFIFDINSYYKLKEVIGNNTFIEDQENLLYIWQNYFDEKNNLSEFYLTFFVKEFKDYYKRFDEYHIEKAYKIDEIVELLGLANFSEIYYYNGFTLDKPGKKSERVNFVALP